MAAGDTSANTYTGLTTVSNGNLALNKAAGTTSIAGNLTVDGTGTVSLSANEQIANTSTVTISSSSGAAFSVGSRTETIANLTINGVTGVNAVTGATGTLIVAGSGTISDNTGNITVQNLTTGTGGLSMGSGVTVSSNTTLNGDVTFNGASTGATFGAGAITLNGNRNFTVADATAATDLTVSGAISDGSAAGSGVTKLGAGTLALTVANTYTGTTTVSAGTLLVNGSTAAASAVTVNSGGTLGGSGTVNGTVLINNGGILSPGASVGTLNTGALTLNDTSSLVFELGTSSDLVAVIGNLTLDGKLTVTDSGGFGASSQYELFSYTGTLTDNTLDVVSAPSGFSYMIDTGTAGFVFLDVTAVPEPGTYFAAALALGGLIITQRKRITALRSRT